MVYELTLENFKEMVRQLPDGIVITKVENENLNDIKLVYANDVATDLSKFDFKAHIDERIEDAYQMDMSNFISAITWKKVVKTQKSEYVDNIEFRSPNHPFNIFASYFFPLGKNFVVSHYISILFELQLEKKLAKIEEKARELLDFLNGKDAFPELETLNNLMQKEEIISMPDPTTPKAAPVVPAEPAVPAPVVVHDVPDNVPNNVPEVPLVNPNTIPVKKEKPQRGRWGRKRS